MEKIGLIFRDFILRIFVEFWLHFSCFWLINNVHEREKIGVVEITFYGGWRDSLDLIFFFTEQEQLWRPINFSFENIIGLHTGLSFNTNHLSFKALCSSSILQFSLSPTISQFQIIFQHLFFNFLDQQKQNNILRRFLFLIDLVFLVKISSCDIFLLSWFVYTKFLNY